MHLAKRAALTAAVLFLSVGLTACKKKEKDGEKKTDPTAQGSGSASASGSGSASGSAQKETPAAEALKGFKGAMAEAKAPGAAGGGMGLGGGGMGIGAKLGGLFGGGAAKAEPTAAAAAGAQDEDRHAMGEGQDPSAAAVADEPAPAAAAGIQFPPAGAAGGDCDKVTERLMIIVSQMMNAELAELTAEQKAAASKELETQMTAMQTEIMRMCTEEKWSQELKDCALAAMSEADFEKCDQYAPEDLKEDEPVAGEDYPAEPAQPVAAWTGGDDCKAVGDRMVQLATAQMGDIPAEYKAELEASLATASTEIQQACESTPFPEAARKCILAAGTIDAAGECLGDLGGGM